MDSSSSTSSDSESQHLSGAEEEGHDEEITKLTETQHVESNVVTDYDFSAALSQLEKEGKKLEYLVKKCEQYSVYLDQIRDEMRLPQ